MHHHYDRKKGFKKGRLKLMEGGGSNLNRIKRKIKYFSAEIFTSKTFKLVERSKQGKRSDKKPP